MTLSTFAIWCAEQHAKTNHFYDDNLPYSYHLTLAYKAAVKFKHLLKHGQEWVLEAIWGHDLIEDARVTFNDIVKAAANCGITARVWAEDGIPDTVLVAEAIRAVTNYGRGRNRGERMPDYIYQEIRETPGATFMKICDRIANVRHGLISESSMYKKYQKEQADFKSKLYTEEYKEMWDYLDKLLNIDL